MDRHAKLQERQTLMSRHLMAGGEIKAFAADTGISIPHAHLVARLAGFTAMKVTQAERSLILERRKEAA